MSQGQSSGQGGGGQSSSGQSDLWQEIQDVKRDQEVQAATQAGAQATQAAAQAGLAATVASGFVCLIVGTLLGIAIARS